MKDKKEIISYLFFGVLATVVNIVCFQIFNIIFGEELYLLSNVLSWIITVIFAFITNKLWVFESKSWKFSVIKTEIIGFTVARVFSLVLEEAGLYLLIDLLNLKSFSFEAFGFIITGSLIAKVIMQVIVVLSNYIFSKFIIFKRRQ